MRHASCTFSPLEVISCQLVFQNVSVLLPQKTHLCHLHWLHWCTVFPMTCLFTSGFTPKENKQLKYEIQHYVWSVNVKYLSQKNGKKETSHTHTEEIQVA